MQPVFSPRNIRPGQVFEASFGAPEPVPGGTVAAVAAPSAADATARLLSLSFSPSVERQITVSLTAPDEYSVEEIQKKLDSRYQRAGATIDSSLYLAAIQSGIPASIVVEMIHMFSYAVDFQRDVHQGDQFEVFFNHYFTPDGEPAKTGNILAATMTLGGKDMTLYRFETPNGPEYFDVTGSSAKSMLMMTPVDGARISSGFGRRRHPILGYGRMHQGIDFAVPSGTPIMAAGDGTVALAGRSGGYGNLLVLNHSNGYSTAYGHLSRFAAGIRPGVRVKQGQAVAFSGNTGLSTGPHLHYEIRINGRQVNPRTVKVAAGRKLEGQELQAFTAERTRLETLIASMPVQNRVAAVEELRETSDR
jgi:murein DD-endopeptidase MepM/ murein hydrolase activator NlpD